MIVNLADVVQQLRFGETHWKLRKEVKEMKIIIISLKLAFIDCLGILRKYLDFDCNWKVAIIIHIIQSRKALNAFLLPTNVFFFTIFLGDIFFSPSLYSKNGFLLHLEHNYIFLQIRRHFGRRYSNILSSPLENTSNSILNVPKVGLKLGISLNF